MSKDELERRIRKRGRIIKFCIFLICIGIMVSLALKSNYFLIKNVIVQNNSYVSKAEIMSLADVESRNLFLISKKKIEEKIMTDPYIESVSVSRKLPSTVVINVSEKEIKGLVKYQNQYINIDSNGKMVQIVNKIPDGQIPLIEGVNVEQYVPGKSIAGNDTLKEVTLKTVLTITDYKECQNLFYSIDITDPYNIILTTNNKIKVNIGDCTDLEYKLAFAVAALNNPEIKGQTGTIEISPSGTATFKKD